MGRSFDIDELQQVLQPPSIKLGGQEYVGRYPSFNERWEIEARWNEADLATEEQHREFVRYMAGKVGVPAEPLFDLSEAVLGEVMLYFLGIARGVHVATTAEVPSNGQSTPSASAAEPSLSPSSSRASSTRTRASSRAAKSRGRGSAT